MGNEVVYQVFIDLVGNDWHAMLSCYSQHSCQVLCRIHRPTWVGRVVDYDGNSVSVNLSLQVVNVNFPVSVRLEFID